MIMELHGSEMPSHILKHGLGGAGAILIHTYRVESSRVSHGSDLLSMVMRVPFYHAHYGVLYFA